MDVMLESEAAASITNLHMQVQSPVLKRLTDMS